MGCQMQRWANYQLYDLATMLVCLNVLGVMIMLSGHPMDGCHFLYFIAVGVETSFNHDRQE